MKNVDLKEYQARLICVEFLLLHDAIKRKKGSLDKMARIIFNSNNKNGRDPRLSQARTNAELFLSEPACNLAKLPGFGAMTLQDVNDKMKQEGAFQSSTSGDELSNVLKSIEDYLKKISWKPWKGDALSRFKEEFKSSAERWKNWEGLIFNGFTDEAIKKVVADHFDVCYVSAIYNNKELDTKFKAIFKIYASHKKVEWEYYELPSESQSRLIFKLSGKIIEEDKVAHFFFDERPRFISIAKGNTDWDSASPYLYGTYSWADADGPTVGKIFLKQADSYENAKKSIGTRTEPVIQTSLLFKKITAGNNIAYDIKDIPGYHEIQKIKELAGEYRGYYLSHHESKLLFECRLLVEESGKVSFWENRADAEPSNGVARFLDNVFMIRLNYEPSIDFFRSFINLKRSYLDASSEILHGTFGFPLDDDLPQSGRIFFYKSDHRQNQPDLFSTATPRETMEPLEVIRLRDKANVEYFLKKVPLAKEIIRFLQGFAGDRMSDDPFLCFWGTELDIRKTSMHNVGNAHAQLGLSAIVPPANWVGVYEFYLFQHHLNPMGFRLECMKMEILADGSINFSAKRSDYKGVIFKSKNKADALLATISKEDSYQQDVFLCFQEMKTKENHDNDVIFGTYAGFGQVSELQPTGGRFIAYKTDASITPEEFDIKDEQSRQRITIKRPDIFDYFLGFKDTIVGSYRMYNELNLVPNPNLQAKNEMERLKGCYRLLKLTSTMNKIADALLVIHGDGRVQLTSIDGKTYHGVVNIFFGMMAFNFHHLDNDDTFALTLFAKAEKAMEVGDYLVGLHLSKILDKPQAYCARSILKKISHNPDEAPKAPNTVSLFQIPTSKNTDDYTLFEKKNAEYNNGLAYLTGPENNYIRGPHGQSPDYFNKTQRFEKRFDHGLSLFLTAKYLSDSYSNRELISKYWDAALQNGFSSKLLIDEFRKELNNSKHLYKTDVDRFIQMIDNSTPFELPNNPNTDLKVIPPPLKVESNIPDGPFLE